MKNLALASVLVLSIFTLTALSQKKPTSKPGVVPPNVAKQTTDTKLFGINLIKNGNAESGNGNGWSNADELKTILYGEFGGGPGPDSPGPANRGERYFYARTTTSQPTAVFSQKIDITNISVTTDKGTVTYNFGGWFGVANGSSSSGRLKLRFLDAAGNELKHNETGEIDESNRPPDEVLIEKNGSGSLPVGTRKIEIVLEFKIFDVKEAQRDNLAFADDLSLILINTGDK